MLVAALAFSSFTYCDCGGRNLECGTLVKSTCMDDFTSKWNRNKIGYNLKTWINQIEALTYLKKADTKHYYSRKKVLQERIPGWNITIARYIANIDCRNGRTVGKLWKTAGTVSNHQFADGFLYGQEDKKGTLSGMNAHSCAQKK